MSSDIAINVQHLDKHFHLYASPRARIQHYLSKPIRRLFGLQPTQHYKEFRALSDISLTIKKGESIGILGRNGAGKSTLLQIISGTLTPTNGTVDINGRVAALLELGSGFNMEFTGRENVVMNCALLGLSKQQTAACLDTIIDFSEIGDFIDQPVKTYSSGMLMRLAFSVQIAVEPDILIIDEALAVGDVFFMAKCIDFMKTRMQHTTRIFVSHDHAAVANLCDRAIFLDHGKLLMSGTPLACIEAYTRFVHNDGESNATDDDTEELLPAGFIRIPENKRGGKSNLVIKG
jgi:lipopolysaccharide transport system ATP-binding protein